MEEDKNLCVSCGTDMGPMNPRQLCGKTYCTQEGQGLSYSEQAQESQPESQESLEKLDLRKSEEIVYKLQITSESTNWEFRSEEEKDIQTYLFSSKEQALIFLKQIYPALNTKDFLKEELLNDPEGISFVRHSSHHDHEENYDRYGIKFNITLEKDYLNPFIKPEKTYFRRTI